MKTGYQGIDGAFSSIAARVLSPESSEYIGYVDFYGAFDALDRDIVDNIAIPLENSTAGRVADPHRLIAKYDVHFHAEYILEIQHNLLVKPGVKLEDITEIYSHEQAIMQCEGKLKKIFADINPNVKLIKMEDTAIAAKNVSLSNRNDIAAIASSRAAEIYGLNILIPSVQDMEDNYTSFVLISKKKEVCTMELNKKYITSMLFEIKNQPGSLAFILNTLHSNQIDITKIESYIPGIRSERAQFFLSCIGHCEDSDLNIAISQMQKACNWVKIFGSYEADSKRF